MEAEERARKEVHAEYQHESELQAEAAELAAESTRSAAASDARTRLIFAE